MRPFRHCCSSPGGADCVTHPKSPRPTWSVLLPVALAAIGLWLYSPTAEYVIGGKDPGTLLNEGVQIAQRGQIVLRDADIASVPAPFRDFFFPPHLNQQQWYYGIRFMGFFIQDPADGRVIGQFPHLFPASIAIGYGLNGLSGARQAVAVWAILGLVAVYFVGARMFGRPRHSRRRYCSPSTSPRCGLRGIRTAKS